MQTTVPVLVVGAGPAGLVTASGLAYHGVRSLVIERHASTSIFPRATGVSVRSMEIFRSWGIDDAVRRGGWRVIPRQATVRRLDDRNPTEVPLGFPDEATSLAVSPTTAAVCPQDHLEPVLVDLYRSLGGEIRFSTELVAIDQEPDGIVATLRDRVDGGTSVVRSSWLVGADGHRSAVRAALGIPMVGPDDLGRFMSVLFRADLSDVLGEATYGLYVIEGEGPPTVLVPSGADDRFVLGMPLPPEMDDAAVAAAFPLERCVALIRAATGRPDLPVEVLATSSFAFSAQVAARMRDGRAFLVGDAAHRMTPRGGRGMNTAIADGFDLGWKLAWVERGLAGPALLDSYEAERAPIGRRNVELSMALGGGGTDDGLAEDLGVVVASSAIAADPGAGPARDPAAAVFPPDGRPGSRAPHAWLASGAERVSTLDLFGREFVLLAAGDGATWRDASSVVPERGPELPLRVVAVGRDLDDADGTFAARYGLADGGAVLVRPDGIVAWRCVEPPADAASALGSALATATGRGADEARPASSEAA
ncbi:MAG TPA: FAD-dependent monooxygenase [Candidatus Limnocylindrales bacterium]|nr:FAD-dependent monooxygenase [Candidatus Limnocylindrales bacterium]